MSDAETTQIGLKAFFCRDHARLDKLFDECLKSGFKDCQAELDEFAAGLVQHIIWEEEYLFPVFEHVSQMFDKGPTFVMRSDHHSIQELLYELVMGARAGNPDIALASQLQGLLLQHNQAEENVLYEAVESMLMDESLQELLTHLNTCEAINLEEWLEGVVEVEESETTSDGGSPISKHGHE